MDTRENRLTVLMLPWLAHGHVSPFLELAKQLIKRDFKIFLCSSPINLESIRKRISTVESISIKLVELHLPSLPDLPPHYHTTNGLPPHLMPKLFQAFEMAIPTISNILENLNPDLLIYDFNQPWAAEIASSQNIPSVYFLTAAAVTGCRVLHFYKRPHEKIPFSNDNVNKSEPSAHRIKVRDCFARSLERSWKIILVKSFRALEEKYISCLSGLVDKLIIPVGPLVRDPTEDADQDDTCAENVLRWLDRRDKSSVVFVSFGSECFLSREEREEIAYGLELSKVNFIWVVRFPHGEKYMKLEEELPKGFVDRVGEKGMVLEEWAPQARILGHSSIGGFVSHCGWSSVTESMKFGIPIIAIATDYDRPVNARLVVEAGVGMEVVRDETSGRFKSVEIAKVIRKVVAEKSGEDVRRKTREMSEKMREEGMEEIDRAAEELVQLCRKKEE